MIDGFVYLALFCFGAATILPIPSESAVIALAIQPGISLVAVWLVATSANTAGSMVNWWMGRACLKWQDRHWFPVGPAQLARAQGWFQRWGQWSLLLAWVPLVGDPLTIAAGVLGVRLPIFVVLVALGKAARYAAVLLALDTAARVIGS